MPMTYGRLFTVRLWRWAWSKRPRRGLWAWLAWFIGACLLLYVTAATVVADLAVLAWRWLQRRGLVRPPRHRRPSTWRLTLVALLGYLRHSGR